MKPLGSAQGAFSLECLLKNTLTNALVALLVGCLIVGIYSPGLQGNFFFDDIPNILTSEAIRLDSLSFESFYSALLSGRSGPLGRPVAQLSFALNYFFNGLSPFAFKTTNLAIHLLCGCLVFVLALKLFSSQYLKQNPEQPYVASVALTAVWLLHPIQLLPVLHVVQRMTSLSALFLLAALLLHIHGRDQHNSAWLLLAWFVFWPLSVLSKESGLLFPAFALAWELIIRRRKEERLDTFSRIFLALMVLGTVAVVAYALSPNGQWLWAGYNLRGFSLGERLMTEGRILWFYLGLIFLPQLEHFGLFHDDIALSTGLVTPWTTLPSLAGLFGLAVVVWKTRRQAPLVSLGITWFLVGHSMESTVLPLEIAHEHRNYLPLLGALLPLIWFFSRLTETHDTKKTLGITCMLAVVSYITLITTLRADQFGEEVKRTQIEAQHHRKSSRSQFEAGRALSNLPEASTSSSPIYAFARAHFELAFELDSNAKLPFLALVNLNCKANLAMENSWVEELGRRLSNTPFAPGDQTVLYAAKELSLGNTLCLDRPDVDNLFSAAFSNPTTSLNAQATMRSWHADYLWLHEKDLQAARESLAKSLKLVPGNPSNQLKWAQLLLLSEEREEAKRLLIALRNAKLSSEERKTRKELLAKFGITEQ